MFTKRLFPAFPFPDRIFPESVGYKASDYALILLSVQAALQNAINEFGLFPDRLFPLSPYPNQLFPKTSPKFGDVRAPITLLKEPPPLTAGPTAFIMPGPSRWLTGEIMGDGRYYSGYEGRLKVRVVDKSISDYTGSDNLRLTQAVTGLMRSADFVVDVLDIEFPVDSNGDALTQEPMVLEEYSSPELFGGAGEWGAIDLTFKFPWTHTISQPEANNTEITATTPSPTGMADLLLSVQNAILQQGYFNDVQTSIVTRTERPFPLTGGPYVDIRPGIFRCVDADKYGAGRNYATMEGNFIVSPWIHNSMDITGRADLALTVTNPAISLYCLAQNIVEQLQLWFLGLGGQFVAENPLALSGISKPRYLKGNSSYVGLDLEFTVRYQEDLSPSDNVIPA